MKDKVSETNSMIEQNRRRQSQYNIFLTCENTAQQADKLAGEELVVLPESSTEEIKTMGEHLFPRGT